MTQKPDTDLRLAMSDTKEEAIQKIKDLIAKRSFTRLLVIGILHEADEEVEGDRTTVLMASSESPLDSALLMLRGIEGMGAARGPITEAMADIIAKGAQGTA